MKISITYDENGIGKMTITDGAGDIINKEQLENHIGEHIDYYINKSLVSSGILDKIYKDAGYTYATILIGSTINYKYNESTLTIVLDYKKDK